MSTLVLNIPCGGSEVVSLYVGPMACKQISELVEALLLHPGLLIVLLVLGSVQQDQVRCMTL